MADGYRKLPGKGRRADGQAIATHYATSRLWLAEDHLLMVDEVYADQSVRRFHLKDIQQILLRKTNRFAIYNAILGILLLLVATPVFMVTEEAWRIFFAVFAGVVFLPLLINLIKGTTTKGFIVTAVHRIEIPSFGRLRSARKALAIIIPAIEAVQGVYDPASQTQSSTPDHAPNVGGPPVRADLNPVLTPGTAAARAATGANSATDRWHRYLYPLLILDGATTLITIFYNNLAMMLGGFICFATLSVFSAMALARQDTPLVSPRLRVWTKVVLGYVILALVVGWVEYMALIVGNPELAATQHEILLHIADLEPFEEPWFLIHLLFFGVASLILGIVGVVWLRDAPVPDEEIRTTAPPELPVVRESDELLKAAGSSTPPELPATKESNDV